MLKLWQLTSTNSLRGFPAVFLLAERLAVRLGAILRPISMTSDIKKKFLEAYEQNADALFRYCFFSVSDRETAIDIVQSAFMKTWDHIADGGEVMNFKAFIYKTVKNMIIDFYRSKKTVSLDVLKEDDNFDPASDEDVAERGADRMDGKIAFDLLQKLPDEYREIIVLRLVDNLSFKEIAAMSDQTENAAAVRFHRGLKKVKDLFNRDNNCDNR